MKAIAKKCKSLRDLTITDLQVDTQGLSAVRSSVVNNDRIIKASEREKSMNGLGAANKLKWLVSDASICLRLKKIELASYDGFCDRDLACIPAACPNLQWVDFHFSFTFPKTLISLVKHCPNLLYLRLFHSNPPLIFDASTPSTPTLSATSATQRPSTASSAGTGRQSQSRKERKRGANATGRKVKACAADEESARVVEPKWVNVRVPLGSNALAAPVALKKKSKAVYPCSSAECQALIAFALGANAAGGKTERGAKEETIPALSRKLRVLDLSGNHGLSDYILSTSFADGLTNLHTLFLEGCDEGLSEVGIVKFAEKRWKSLKRMHLRNCRGVALNVYQENFLAKGLEIDVVVDGGRLRNLD
ncbi:hypothetical protein BC830DRAFT_962753 [Chytriomyces sp. MP71]|nr:hypothetical protein BC830DRAFT_962753 [Chytriomyces sp. MP71]